MRRLLGVVAGVVLVGAGAAHGLSVRSSVTLAHASLQLSSPSAGAERVNYTVSFVAPRQLTAGGASKPSITLTGPKGTVFPQYSCGVYELVDDTLAGTGGCGVGFTLGKPASSVTLDASGVKAGDLVSFVIHGVANPTASGEKTLTLTTSAHSRPVAFHYRIVPARAVSAPYLQLSSYAAGATHVTWAVGFTTPDRLIGDAPPTGNSQITLQAPAGTVFPPNTGCNGTYTLVDPSDTDVHCIGATVGGHGSTLTLDPFTTSPGALVSIVIVGVRNPSGGSLRVSTSSDPRPIEIPVTHATLPAGVQFLTRVAGAKPAQWSAEFPLKTGFEDGKSSLTIAADGAVLASGGYVLYDLANGHSAGAQTGAGGGQCTTSPYTPGPRVEPCEGIGAGGMGMSPGDEFAVTAVSMQNSSGAGSHTLDIAASTGGSHQFRYTLGSPRRANGAFAQVAAAGAGAGGDRYSVTFATTDGLPGFGPLAALGGLGAVQLGLKGAKWAPIDTCSVVDTTLGAVGSASDFGAQGPLKTDPSTTLVTTPFDIPAGDLATVTCEATSPGGGNVLTLSTTSDHAVSLVPVTRSG